MRRFSVLLIAASSTAVAQPLPPAQTPARPRPTSRPALARIARIDPQLGSVIALDPSAMDQARAVDAGSLRGRSRASRC